MSLTLGQQGVSVSVDPINSTKMIEAENTSSSALDTVETEEIVEVSGDWERSQYTFGIKASEEDQRKFDLALTHENNTAKLLMFLARTFASSIAISIIVLSANVNNPNVDKVLLKDTIPSLIDKQAALLTASIGGYLYTSRGKSSKPR